MWCPILLATVCLLLSACLVQAGDDASVHVHVESSPGPQMQPMGMTLPLFNYYNGQAGGQSGFPSPELVAALTKSRWEGDEVHSQGPDAPAVQPPMPVRGQRAPQHSHGGNSGERVPPTRPLQINPQMPVEYDYQPVARQTHRYTQDSRFPMEGAGQYGRTSIDYDIPFPSVNKKIHTESQPRHQHGGTTEFIPPWLLRKRQLSKYGLKKYLTPFARANLNEMGALERMEQYHPEAEPIYPYPRAARMMSAEPRPAQYYAPHDDDGVVDFYL